MKPRKNNGRSMATWASDLEFIAYQARELDIATAAALGRLVHEMRTTAVGAKEGT